MHVLSKKIVHPKVAVVYCPSLHTQLTITTPQRNVTQQDRWHEVHNTYVVQLVRETIYKQENYTIKITN